MKKPTEAIEWMKKYDFVGTSVYQQEYVQEIIAYLDSIPEWPADLTRERLEKLADQTWSFAGPCNALRRLAAIAPKAEKMKLGDKVEKIGGDYTFAGVIVADFIKLSGARRFVVEDDRGVLHVYSEKNLHPSSAEIDA